MLDLFVDDSEGEVASLLIDVAGHYSGEGFLDHDGFTRAFALSHDSIDGALES